jgi:hypothetical protein
LFFEPWLDSQQLGVPQDTAEEVGRELHRLSVLSVWTRVRCPEVPADEDGTIIETSSDKELEQVRSEPCPHCGTFHDIVPTFVETLYAPNFPKSDHTAPFKPGRLNLRHPRPMVDDASRDQQTLRCLAIAADPTLDGQPFVLLLKRTLATNTDLESVPSPQAAWANAWKGPLIIVVGYFILIGPIVRLAGQATGWGCGGLAIVVVWLVIRGDTQVKLAPSAASRQFTRWGMMSTVLLLTAGTTGLQFSLSEGNHTTIPLFNSHKLVLPIKIEYGGMNIWLIGSGLLLFVLTGIFVLINDKRIGWFVR